MQYSYTPPSNFIGGGIINLHGTSSGNVFNQPSTKFLDTLIWLRRKYLILLVILKYQYLVCVTGLIGAPPTHTASSFDNKLDVSFFKVWIQGIINYCNTDSWKKSLVYFSQTNRAFALSWIFFYPAVFTW